MEVVLDGIESSLFFPMTYMTFEGDFSDSLFIFFLFQAH